MFKYLVCFAIGSLSATQFRGVYHHEQHAITIDASTLPNNYDVRFVCFDDESVEDGECFELTEQEELPQ